MKKRITQSVFQAYIPFKSRIPERHSSASISFVFEQRIFSILGVGLIALIILYSYFVMLSISHVVVREDTLLASERLASEVAQLEQKYLARSIILTEKMAYTYGFERTTVSHFIERLSSNVAQASAR